MKKIKPVIFKSVHFQTTQLPVKILFQQFFMLWKAYFPLIWVDMYYTYILYIYTYVYLSIYLSIHLSIYLSIYICMYIYIYIHIIIFVIGKISFAICFHTKRFESGKIWKMAYRNNWCFCRSTVLILWYLKYNTNIYSIPTFSSN